MMLEIVPSNQFKKDLKLARKRGCKLEHLRDVVNTLASEQKLDKKYHDHDLAGNYIGLYEGITENNKEISSPAPFSVQKLIINTKYPIYLSKYEKIRKEW